MKLSNEYRYNILCEDAQTKSFIQSFLTEQGINFHRMHFNIAPSGNGCGSQYVRKYYSSEIRCLLSMNYMKMTLIVCIDADNYLCEERVDELKSQLELDFKGEKKYQDFDYTKECIVLWIPKRQIENWIHFLEGEDIDEEVVYGYNHRPKRCKEEARLLSELFQEKVTIEKDMLPSICKAKIEYERVCGLQKGDNG